MKYLYLLPLLPAIYSPLNASENITQNSHLFDSTSGDSTKFNTFKKFILKKGVAYKIF